ncbi:MAG: HAD family phosphatase [Clostridia bacterium]|nr:HAD family phosphatase [Clostridia bacterium]
MIKLIATDLDNTLLDHVTGEVPESTAHLFRQAAQKGVLTAVATGRCFPSALAAAQKIGARTPVICYNGSLIKWGDTGEVIARCCIDTDTIRSVAAFCRDNGLYLQCYDDDDVVICERDCEGLRVDPDVKVVGFREIGDYLTFADLHPTPKMLIVEQPEKVAARLPELAEVFPALEFCQSQPWLIEVLPPNAGKGRAVETLADLMGIDREEVMALGDNTNDLPMIRWAGLGVVVSNGVEAAKAEADYVCAGQRWQGVEEALHKFVL